MMQADAAQDDAMEAGVAMTSTAAPPTTTATTTALEPLQGSNDDDDDGPCGVGARTLKTRIAQGVAMASFVLNVLAMIWEQSAVAIVAGVVACLIAPVVIARQFQMQNTDCMYCNDDDVTILFLYDTEADADAFVVACLTFMMSLLCFSLSL